MTSPRLALRVLCDTDVERVHAAALSMLGEHAAAAERAATAAPETVLLAGREASRDVVLGGDSVWLAAGGPSPLARPVEGGAARRGTAADLVSALRLAEVLPEVGVVTCPPVLVDDSSLLDDLRLCLETTTKHILAATLQVGADAEVAVRMGAAVAGGVAALRRRPLLSLIGGPDSAEAALVFARAGLPVGFYAHLAPQAPETVADLARALACHHAGVLSACRQIQAAAPGAPFIYTVPPAEVLAGDVEEPALFALAALQMASHVGLPACCASLATRAVEAGWRACTDNALVLLSASAAGGPLLVGAGTLAADAVFSPQALVLDAELFSWNARVADGITIDAERLAVAEIEQVGIGGNYLGRRHTRTHARGVWRPRILDRSPWDAWEASGRAGALEKADAVSRDYLNSFTPTPLGRAEQENLSRIVAESGL